MSPEKRDSLFLASPDGNIENLQAYQNVKDTSIQSLNESRANDGKLIGSSRKQWEDFDKMLDQVSSYYKRFKGTEYFPLNDDSLKNIAAVRQSDTAAIIRISISFIKLAPLLQTFF